MMFFSLISLISTVLAAQSPVTGKPEGKSYVCLDGVVAGSNGSQPRALVRHNVQPGGIFYLMKNSDPSNSKNWVPISQYQSDRPMCYPDFSELAFPENADKSAHYCVMYKNSNQEIYSRPYTYSNTQAQWAPSRSVEHDDAIAAGASGKPTTYTTKQLNKKDGSGKKKSARSSNSAAGISCGIFAGLSLIVAFML